MKLTIQGVLRLIDLLVCFSYTVLNLLRNCRFEPVEPLLGICELSSVTLPHRINFAFKFFPEDSELVFEFGAEGLQCVIDSFGFGFRKVAISLDLALDVLELGLKLLFRLDALHEHDIVIAVHLDQLIVHRRQRHIFILLSHIACHVFFDEFHLGWGDFGLHQGVAGRNQGS